MSGLILVPTPLQDDLPLETVALEKLRADSLLENVIILVEEHKVARQRWLKWGLPRETIEKFILFNEHTQEKLAPEILREIKSGKKAYLLSDCGLPAFCDPGQKLVDACHKQGIKVTATPFPNSIALAVALSGFSHERFTFCGFVPVKMPERANWMKQELKRSEMMIWMETPYRLDKMLMDLVDLKLERELFLALDLGAPNEQLVRGNAKKLKEVLKAESKREFVLVISPL